MQRIVQPTQISFDQKSLVQESSESEPASVDDEDETDVDKILSMDSSAKPSGKDTLVTFSNTIDQPNPAVIEPTDFEEPSLLVFGTSGESVPFDPQKAVTDNLQISEEYKLTGEDSEDQESQILIVDDCPFNVVAIKSLLVQFNYSCEHCTTGQEALHRVKNRHANSKPSYKLILMDYSMPELDGPSTT